MSPVSVSVLDFDSLPVKWIDEARIARYRESPRDPRWGLGRLFSAVVPLEGAQTIGLGVQTNPDGPIEWVFSDHAIDDGLSLVDALFRRKGWSFPNPAAPPPADASTAGASRAFLRKLKWSRGAVPPARPRGRRWVLQITLDERTSARFRERVALAGARPVGALFFLCQRALAEYFGLKGATRWMFSTSARHLGNGATADSDLKSSYFLFDSHTSSGLSAVDRRLREELRAGVADGNQRLGRRLARLPFPVLVWLTWIDFYILNRRTLGFFTSFGQRGEAEPESVDRRFFWQTSVRTTRPIAVVAQDWYGRVQVSVNLHARLGVDETGATALARAIGDLLIAEEGLSPP